jgi:pimeloyl-ACP methyl ester carboxylesterase
VEREVQDIGDVIDALQLGAVSIVGHSLGGIVAAAFAVSHPQKTCAFAMIDTPLRSDFFVRLARADDLRAFPEASYPSRRAAARSYRPFPRLTVALPSLLQHIGRYAVKQRPDSRWAFRCDRRAVVVGEGVDPLELLTRARAPLLYVRGAQSALTEPADLARVRAAAHSVACSEIPNAHHHVLLDQPNALGELLRAFLIATACQAATPRVRSCSQTASVELLQSLSGPNRRSR